MPLAILLVRLRRGGRSARFVLGAYLALAGTIRFCIEFLRVNDRVLGPLTVAHVAALAAVLIGAVLIASKSTPRVRPR